MFPRSPEWSRGAGSPSSVPFWVVLLLSTSVQAQKCTRCVAQTGNAGPSAGVARSLMDPQALVDYASQPARASAIALPLTKARQDAPPSRSV
ncbi:hypothetical protein VTN96DRAFT_9404 [Rasamsonia emersonii]